MPATVTATTSISGQTFDFWNAGITANQLIYDFGQTYKRYDASKQTVEAQRAAERTTKLQVLLNVRRAYFTARAGKALVDVAKETLDDQNKHLVQVQGFVTVGTQPEIAQAQQKAAVANAVVQLITAQNNYETSKAQLNQAAGLTFGTEYDVDRTTISRRSMAKTFRVTRSLPTPSQRARSSPPSPGSAGRRRRP